MSDEKNDKWEMPQPIFRSSTGSLPKSLESTISQSFIPNADTIEIEDDDILALDHDGPIAAEILPTTTQDGQDGHGVLESKSGSPAVQPEAEIVGEVPIDAAAQSTADAAPSMPGAANAGPGKFWSYFFVFVLLGLLAAGAVVGVFYFRPR